MINPTPPARRLNVQYGPCGKGGKTESHSLCITLYFKWLTALHAVQILGLTTITTLTALTTITYIGGSTIAATQ